MSPPFLESQSSTARGQRSTPQRAPPPPTSETLKMTGKLRFSKMWSACARARLCPFPENIKGVCYRSLNVMADCVCVRLCMCVCVASLTWRWLMLPGLVGEGLGDFPE